ncbi:hypothetical protein C8K30_110188 [Promicromonospora sp. AC04]|uniref:hypothetical protein n=1 Tax=Promicromonospora sp. AC04 TaxID=2135723 RepID=UPI000D38B1B3|nr:hypothetical protein [Promicromonospora sp. AC04]PUB24044.1 hypothetical protein C8K30_110188 [Promicromonospora sp. AC04]
MSHENWTDDNDFLSGALHGAADEMPGGEVDDLHISFGVIRDRVRRRRAAKIGSLAGGSLVVAGVLAFGVVQTPLWDSADPVVPGAQSPDAYASPDDAPSRGLDPTAEPTTAPATGVIQDGYQPSWLEWSDLTCGMPVDDLQSTAPGWSVAAAGDIYARTSDFDGEPSTSWGMAATVAEGEGTLDVAPVLVWSQGGVVVDLGSNVLEAPGPQSEPLLGAGQGAIAATGNGLTTCAPSETGTTDLFETQLPEGDYEVRVVAYPQIASGQWATAVSEPVSVRIDADGAHTATGTRGGAATVEPSAPSPGEQSRFVLDRTTEWVTAELTQRGYSTDGVVSVTAQCESPNPADSVSFDVVLPSTGDVLGSGEIACGGARSVTPLGVLAGGGEVLDIRLGTVPDGVARLWAVLGPAVSADGEDTTSDCSASTFDPDLVYDPESSPTAAAGTTAQLIVAAAVSCDSDSMIQLATEHGTELMFSTETPEQVFGLPETDALPYETLVRLLTGTSGVVNGGDAGNETITWPRVSTEEFRDSDEAWAEVVESGLLTQAEADAQRADETFGYTGMVIGIAEDGTWRYYSPTD